MDSLYGNLILEPLRTGVNWDRIRVIDSETPSEVFRLAIDQQAAHIIQTKNPYFANDLNTAALLAKDHEAFARAPVSAILKPNECNENVETQLLIFDRTFIASNEKTQILVSVEAVLNKLTLPGSLVADVMVIADELVTNALFNAPFVDLENTRAGASRENQNVQLENGKSARLFIGTDQSRIVVGCRDPYGTLNLNSLFKRIKNCYETSVGDNINLTGSGGAGIGSYMIFNSSASYFAEVKIGVHTIVCCTVPLRMSSRARLNLVKNLHFTTYK